MSKPVAATTTPFAVLSQTAFFEGLTPERLYRVAALSKLQECTEGELVYRIGDSAATVYVLVSGMVRLAIGMGSRQASAGDVLRRGDVFGWAALTPTSRVRIATASCLSPCTFLAIDGAGLLALMEADHTLGFRLATQLNRLVTGTLTTFAAG